MLPFRYQKSFAFLRLGASLVTRRKDKQMSNTIVVQVARPKGGEVFSLYYSPENYTIETAEESARRMGMVVLASHQRVSL